MSGHILRVGISPCPNDVFVFSGLLLDRVDSRSHRLEMRFEDIDTLNSLAHLGALDIVKISYANYPRCSEIYELLEVGAALGRNCGPLLLTGGQAWNSRGQVLVPGKHTTANFLLDYYAPALPGKKFARFDLLYEELRGTPSAQGVVIHEKRFTYEADGLRLVQDLGAFWEHSTGYPIPLGGLVGRRKDSRLESFQEMLRTSLDWAWQHPVEALELCAKYSRDLRPEVIQAHVELYVNAFTRELGVHGMKCLDHFFARIEEKKTAPR